MAKTLLTSNRLQKEQRAKNIWPTELSLSVEEARTVCVVFFLPEFRARLLQKKNTTVQTVGYYYTNQSLILAPQVKASLVRDADSYSAISFELAFLRKLGQQLLKSRPHKPIAIR